MALETSCVDCFKEVMVGRTSSVRSFLNWSIFCLASFADSDTLGMSSGFGFVYFFSTFEKKEESDLNILVWNCGVCLWV